MESINRQNMLVVMLDEFKTKLTTNSLSTEQKLLLLDTYIKNKILSENKTIPSENDLTKYAFLGWYIYDCLRAK